MVAEQPIYRDVWMRIREHLPKKAARPKTRAASYPSNCKVRALRSMTTRS
jgi:hypothetical protein